jgi:hypothetical protein
VRTGLGIRGGARSISWQWSRKPFRVRIGVIVSPDLRNMRLIDSVSPFHHVLITERYAPLTRPPLATTAALPLGVGGAG